jgi:hypothetical protein
MILGNLLNVHHNTHHYSTVLNVLYLEAVPVGSMLRTSFPGNRPSVECLIYRENAYTFTA